jgi:hypothetical protein
MMIDERWRLDSDSPEDRSLIDAFLATRQAERPYKKGAPCPLHEDRESLIWAYADGYLEGAEEDEAWEEISQCRRCLDRLASVQRALHKVEEQMPESVFDLEHAVETAPEPWPVSEIREWILALFCGRREGPGAHRESHPLAVAILQPELVLGEEGRAWSGELSYGWNDVQVTIKTKVELGRDERPRSVAVLSELRDQSGEPVPRAQIDFCDVYGVLMETGVTDEEGQVSFSSSEGQRFIREDGQATQIGFYVELSRGGQHGSWQILVRQDRLDMAI